MKKRVPFVIISLGLICQIEVNGTDNVDCQIKEIDEYHTECPKGLSGKFLRAWNHLIVIYGSKHERRLLKKHGNKTTYVRMQVSTKVSI